MNGSKENMAAPKYTHTKDQSAEFLRQTLPLMAKQSAALNPVSYAVWYEYVSGINPGLSKAIDMSITAGKTLDEETTLALYSQYVAQVDDAKVQQLTESFQDLLTKMSLSAKQTGEQASQYGSALAQWEMQLSAAPATGGQSETDLQDILQNTGLMKESVGGLKNRLDASQSEIETLRVELVRAREEAMTDALTGLHNRKGFERRLADYPDGGLSLPKNLSLMMLDIDHFKRVNDSFGHLFGDKVIRAVAQTIKSNIKGQDIGVRYGGEEFLVFLPETSIDGARHLAEKLRGLIASGRIKRSHNNETVESVTISIGVAGYQSGETVEALIGRADAALYTSKTNGRNRVTAAAATE
jgi:diguanylate cyclase